MKRFAIIGPAQSGKSTFAGYLADALDTTHTDLSAWIVRVEEFRLRRLAELGVDVSGTFDQARNRPNRALLIALGDAVCSTRPSFLIDRAFEVADIIAGIRRTEEFQCLPSDVIAIYINRPGIATVQDNFNLSQEDADLIVENDATLDVLKYKASIIARLERSNQLVRKRTLLR